MIVLALPYSKFHFELLRQNLIECKLTILNVNNVYSKNINYTNISIGKEFKCVNIFNNLIKNKNYYDLINQLINENKPDKIIIFNMNTSLSHFIYNKFNYKINIELWEDGIDHYIKDYGGFNYYVKNLIKFMNGYYLYDIRKKDFNLYENLKVYNRFQYSNLHYEYLFDVKQCKQINKILFVGQPLVEDNIITRKKYFQTIDNISKKLKLEIDYIPHPRETIILKNRLDSIEVIKNNKSTEDYLKDNDYKVYISPYSTVLLNTLRYNKSYYITNLLGLISITKKLKKLDFLPIKVIDSIEEIKI